MPKRLMTVVCTVILSACSSGGGPTPTTFGGSTGLQLTVENERQRTVTAYVQWRGSREIRLGEVRSRRTETFDTPMRGREMRVTFGDPGSRSGAAGSDFVAVDRGEHLLWTITTTGVFYRRLPPA